MNKVFGFRRHLRHRRVGGMLVARLVADDGHGDESHHQSPDTDCDDGRLDTRGSGGLTG